ncbi:MAG: hypothetical protein NTV10_02405 [Methanoregula sp.]|jgi:hypothetical protein|nr:hypothetical protein [Methanoregula sp.]
MPKVKKITGMAPLPHYVMLDESEPEYELIFKQLQDYRKSLIGSSYYYVRAGDERCCLCRIVHGGGKVFFHEMVDHHKHGISDEDIEESVKFDNGSFSLPGHYHISPRIETKLRALYDI